jgi:dipeptidyl aminopeptidase/acylaminoacyl peptidase
MFAAFGNGAPRISHDGKTMLYRSNRDGLPQPYVVTLSDPRATPRALLKTRERVAYHELAPGTDTVVFASDKGADENFSLFACDLNGEHLRELTPGETLQRDQPLFASKLSNTVFFSARANKETSTRVYAVALDGKSPPKLLHTEPGASGLVSVSPDGSAAFLVRSISLSRHELVRVDLKAGAANKVYPAIGDAAVFDAAFLPDGKTCLVATDAGAEANLVLKIDCRSGKELARYQDSEHPVGAVRGLLPSRRGDLVALDVDAGNRRAVRLLDVKTMKLRRNAELPLGDGSSGAFAPDDRTLFVRWATPTVPGDIFAVSTSSGAAKLVRDETRSGLSDAPPLAVRIDQVTAFDGLKIPVNVYVPAQAASAPKSNGQKLPVIVMVHGGPASSSTVSYSPLTRFYTAHGFAVVEPNIRGSTGFGRAYEQADDGRKRLDAVRDVETVARWAAQSPWADPSRMVIWGGSYGGYMVLMGMTRQSDLWAAGVDLVGPSSWRSFMATTTGQIRDVLSKEFGSVETDGAFLDSISPLADIAKVKRPLFVFQGKNDPRVPQSESDQIVRSLRARQVPVEYMLAEDEGHSLDRRPNQIAFAARTTLFLEKHLGMR